MALAALSGDEQCIIFSQLCNVLDPGLAVAFGSASSELRALTQAQRQQLRADHEVAAALCLKASMRSCKELREAKLAMLKRFSSSDLETLGTLGSVLPALEELCLMQPLKTAGPDGVQRLAEGLGAGALPAVRLLDLRYVPVDDAAASALAAALGRGALPRLKILSLTGAAIGDAGLVALAPALWRRPTLEHLNLWDNPFGDEGLAALLAPPPAGALSLPAGALTKLKSIGLGYTRVTDAGCASLAAALDSGALPALEQLGLSSLVWPPTASAAARAAVQQALLQAQMRELIQEALLRAVVREVVQEAAVAAVQRAATAALEEEARKKEAHAERFVDFNEAAFLRASAATGGIGPYDDGDVDEAVGSI